MSNVILRSLSFPSTFFVPSSKSVLNRLLILASLCSEDVTLACTIGSSDTRFLIDCLIKVGVNIIEDEHGLTIKGCFPQCESKSCEIVALNSGDGGTTNRFLAAFLALGENRYQLNGTPNLNKRPHQHLFDSLRNLGVQIECDDNCFAIIQGPILEGKTVFVDTTISSQFASALKLVSFSKNIIIDHSNIENSKKYFQMTENILSRFVNGERSFKVPVDFSSLSYPVVLALSLNKKLIIPYVNTIDKDQADSILFDIIKSLGSSFSFEKDSLVVNQTDLSGNINISAKLCPDLVPTLIFLASRLQGMSQFFDMDLLCAKESDRFSEIIVILNLFKIKFKVVGTTLSIMGRNDVSMESVCYNAPDDHRMVLLAALFMILNSGGEIYNSECVIKSFSGFFDQLK